MADYDSLSTRLNTGRFIKVTPPPESACNCQRPSSEGGKAWKYMGRDSDMRDHSIWDRWVRQQDCDIPEIKNAVGKYKDGDKTY